MTTGDMPSRPVRIVLGLLLAACGMIGVLAAFDVGPLHARDIHGPPWLGAVAGGIFIVGAGFLWAGDASARIPWLGHLLATLVLAGLAAIGNWIAFGAGPRECSGGFSLFYNSKQAAEIECRVAFGIGALMMDGILIWMLGMGLRKLGVQGVYPIWIERLGKAMLFLALSPIVLVLLVIVIGKSLVEALTTYWRTGKWPRNEAFIARQKKRREEASS